MILTAERVAELCGYTVATINRKASDDPTSSFQSCSSLYNTLVIGICRLPLRPGREVLV